MKLLIPLLGFFLCGPLLLVGFFYTPPVTVKPCDSYSSYPTDHYDVIRAYDLHWIQDSEYAPCQVVIVTNYAGRMETYCPQTGETKITWDNTRRIIPPEVTIKMINEINKIGGQD